MYSLDEDKQWRTQNFSMGVRRPRGQRGLKGWSSWGEGNKLSFPPAGGLRCAVNSPSRGGIRPSKSVLAY